MCSGAGSGAVDVGCLDPMLDRLLAVEVAGLPDSALARRTSPCRPSRTAPRPGHLPARSPQRRRWRKTPSGGPQRRPASGGCAGRGEAPGEAASASCPHLQVGARVVGARVGGGGTGGGGRAVPGQGQEGLLQPEPGDLEVPGRGEVGDQRSQHGVRVSAAQRDRLAVHLHGGDRRQPRRGFWTAMRDWTAHGRTVLFATHYLEEADAYADRAVLLARGRVVADGPTTELKAAVGGRLARATLPEAEPERLRGLATVTAVQVHGEAVTLRCTDPDSVLRTLVADFPAARDFEVTGLGLEEAFLALTGDGPATATGSTATDSSTHDSSTHLEVRT